MVTSFGRAAAAQPRQSGATSGPILPQVGPKNQPRPRRLFVAARYHRLRLSAGSRSPDGPVITSGADWRTPWASTMPGR